MSRISCRCELKPRTHPHTITVIIIELFTMLLYAQQTHHSDRIFILHP
jgi:hypothetical protein